VIEATSGLHNISACPIQNRMRPASPLATPRGGMECAEAHFEGRDRASHTETLSLPFAGLAQAAVTYDAPSTISKITTSPAAAVRAASSPSREVIPQGAPFPPWGLGGARVVWPPPWGDAVSGHPFASSYSKATLHAR